MTQRYLTTCLIALFMALPVMASAETPLPFWPTRDVTVNATITNPVSNEAKNTPKTLHTVMQYQSAQQRMRITTDLMIAGQSVGYNIMDYKAQKAITVMPPMHMYMENKADKTSLVDALSDPNLKKEKAGTATVAGLTCTVWQVTFKDNSGKGCVTDDGVVLSYDGLVPTGKNGEKQPISMIATSVKYEPLADSLFTVPADYQAFSPENQMKMLKGMMNSMKRQ